MEHDLKKLVKLCKKKNKAAQKKLYDLYSPVLFGICLRYGRNKADADDILQKGFIKILTKINQYSDKGSFEGWMKRVVVNTAITHYHKYKKHRYSYDVDQLIYLPDSEITVNDYGAAEFTKEELLKVINDLPDGYRTVFNLYAIEGYKHKEIAEKLDININTSKSQYSRAKVRLQEMLEEMAKINLDGQE
ncbi:MAG: RNA polymerase sigma factor [Bacteroidota bacterium]|nr:RNA polymerase sigma factor [Bacteroidota bacterium]